MSDINFICPTCKRPTHPTDNEIIEYLVKEKDRYRDILGKRTKELICTRKALDVAKYAIKNIKNDMKKVKDGDDIWEIQKNLHDYCKTTIKKITALEQKDVK